MDIEKVIDEIRKLPDDWNGYGAKPISKEVCDNALRFAKLFEGANHLAAIAPTANDSIQFEFERDNTYFEIEVFADRYTCLYCDSHGDDMILPLYFIND